MVVRLPGVSIFYIAFYIWSAHQTVLLFNLFNLENFMLFTRSLLGLFYPLVVLITGTQYWYPIIFCTRPLKNLVFDLVFPQVRHVGATFAAVSSLFCFDKKNCLWTVFGTSFCQPKISESSHSRKFWSSKVVFAFIYSWPHFCNALCSGISHFSPSWSKMLLHDSSLSLKGMDPLYLPPYDRCQFVWKIIRFFIKQSCS